MLHSPNGRQSQCSRQTHPPCPCPPCPQSLLARPTCTRTHHPARTKHLNPRPHTTRSSLTSLDTPSSSSSSSSQAAQSPTSSAPSPAYGTSLPMIPAGHRECPLLYFFIAHWPIDCFQGYQPKPRSYAASSPLHSSSTSSSSHRLEASIPTYVLSLSLSPYSLPPSHYLPT